MNHGMVKVGDLIPDLAFPKPAPKEDRAPIHKPPKVVGDPTRTPVNKQAAMLVTRAHHLHLPPLPPEAPKKSELEALREEVAILRANNAQLKHENNALRRKLGRPRCKEHEPKKTTEEGVPRAEEKPASRKLAILERLIHG